MLEELVGKGEASIGLPVLDEEISANTSKSSTTTWDLKRNWHGLTKVVHLIRVVRESLEENGEYVVNVVEHLLWNLNKTKFDLIQQSFKA